MKEALISVITGYAGSYLPNYYKNDMMHYSRCGLEISYARISRIDLLRKNDEKKTSTIYTS